MPYDAYVAARVRAPELRGAGGWLNTGGAELGLEALRGKIVLLDFWTFCCVNCLHVLDELRELEAEFPDELVIIGVHSPKFVHEADHEALVAAVERHEVHHPVLDDPELSTWHQYDVRAWPTLVVIDPDGFIVGTYSGEGHLHAVRKLVRSLTYQHAIRTGDHPYVPPVVESGLLRFPSKTLRLDGDRILVADTGHHRLVVLYSDLETVQATVGEGVRGFLDGPFDQARFSEPSAICELPPDVAARVGYRYLIADTGNHSIRGARADGFVFTAAGNGRQWMQNDPLPHGSWAYGPMSSPWDLVWSEVHRAVIVAMAGIHQLWLFDPVAGRVSVYAGTTNEGLVDGPAHQAWLAQTSGVDIAPDGSLWMVDAETSSLRRMHLDRIDTVIGTGLFDFGMRDGDAAQALLQHPLGLCALPDGSIAIADTYNGAIRRYDPATNKVSTVALGLREPTHVDLVGGSLLVTESAAHRLVRVPIDGNIAAATRAFQTQRPATHVRAGVLSLEIVFSTPEGQTLDDRYGPATQVTVTSTPEALLVNGAYVGPEMRLELEIDPEVTEGVLHVAARATSCDVAAKFPACHVHQQDWGVPVVVSEAGVSTLTLHLGAAQAD